MLYENRDEFHHRLSNTVIMVGGKPFYVQQILGTQAKPEIHGWYLPVKKVANPQPVVVPGSDPNIQPFNMRLGFVNLKDHAFYYLRLPVRNYLQGIQNAAIYGKCAAVAGRALNLNALMNEQSFVDCLCNQYPTLEQAIGTLEENERQSTAFCRQFSIHKDDDKGLYYLSYKGNSVGHSSDGKKWKLGKNYTYVREAAEEMKLNVA